MAVHECLDGVEYVAPRQCAHLPPSVPSLLARLKLVMLNKWSPMVSMPLSKATTRSVTGSFSPLFHRMLSVKLFCNAFSGSEKDNKNATLARDNYEWNEWYEWYEWNELYEWNR